VRQLLCTHVVLTRLWLVRWEVFVKQFFCHFIVCPNDQKGDLISESRF
jgi:hypothetical protein